MHSGPYRDNPTYELHRLRAEVVRLRKLCGWAERFISDEVGEDYEIIDDLRAAAGGE